VTEKKFSYAPERIADDLYAIPLPLHDGSPVNAYAAIGDGGLWLIDGGLMSEHSQAALRDGIAALGFAFPRDVRGLLVTHGHTDHVGAADAVLENGGELLAHRLEVTEGRNINFDEDWLSRHGLPEEAMGRKDRWRPFTWPEPTRLLEDGEQLRWGKLDLRVVWCPGHTPGLVCLFEPQRKLLFTTDHVMRRAPAPVSVRNPGHDDPLRDYLRSVDKLKSLAVDTVLPGHGRPFHHLPRRLHEIETQIYDQVETVIQALRSGPLTAYQVLERSEALDRRPIAVRYQLSLILARIRYLQREGQLHEISTDATIKYALVA
jgi:glyoxylase-like metal-dependent hydrolase (beta-lactamase superfamily II)